MLQSLPLVILIFSKFLPTVSGIPEVKVKNTTILGALLPDVAQEFFGAIPFAEPPVGLLRFAPPVTKLDPGFPTLNATQYGPACPQGMGYGSNLSLIRSISEDCLTLNVVRPAGMNISETGPLPVMVWVFGGGFQNGAAYLNDGTKIVARSVERGSPIIYVNINYRLGPFGFPVGSEAEARGALNLGNKDVLAALTWVQENIGAFGGDKDSVTVFGVSAGAIILSEIILDPEFDLARAAIFESGSAASNLMFNASSRDLAWKTLVSAVPDCSNASPNSTFECLRSASAETLINAANHVYLHVPAEFPFAPVIDGMGGIIPDLPSELYARGEFARIPFISGTCLDEGPVFTPPTMNSTELLHTWIVSNITSPVMTVAGNSLLADKILQLYPDGPALGSPFGTGNETFGLSPVYKRASAIVGDLAFTSLRRATVKAAGDHGVKPSPIYSRIGCLEIHRFLEVALLRHLGIHTELDVFSVPHGCQVPYLSGPPLQGPAGELSLTLIDYWVSFATTLDPNDGLGNASRPTWTQYTGSSKAVLQIDSTNLTMIPDTFRGKQNSFIIEYAKAFRH